jgi:hypothetical protein
MPTLDELLAEKARRVAAPAGPSMEELLAEKARRAAELSQKARKDTLAEMGVGERMLVGSGQFFDQGIRGTRQLYNSAVGDQKTLDALNAEEADRRITDDAINSDTAAQAGSFLTGMLATAPLGGFLGSQAAKVGGGAVIKGLATVGGEAIGGGVQGALVPTVEGESRGQNAAESAAIGALIPASGQAFRRVMFGSPAKRAAAEASNKVLREAGAIVPEWQGGGGLAATLDKASSKLPILSGRLTARLDAQDDAVRKHIFKKLAGSGVPTTNEALAAVRESVGKDVDKFLDTGKKWAFGKGASSDIGALIKKETASELPDADAVALLRRIKKVADSKGELGFDDFRRLKAAISKQRKSTTGSTYEALGAARDVLDSFADKSLGPAMAAKNSTTRLNYRTITNLAKADVGVDGIDPAKMLTRLESATKKSPVDDAVIKLLRAHRSTVAPLDRAVHRGFTMANTGPLASLGVVGLAANQLGMGDTALGTAGIASSIPLAIMAGRNAGPMTRRLVAASLRSANMKSQRNNQEANKK